MRITIILLIFIYLSPKIAVAQSTKGQLLWKAKEIKMQTGQEKNLVKFLPAPRPANTSGTSYRPWNYPTIFPSNYYSTQLGWVCKQEWKLEKKSGIPFKLRLGSTEQVDYLEGKQFYRPQPR